MAINLTIPQNDIAKHYVPTQNLRHVEQQNQTREQFAQVHKQVMSPAPLLQAPRITPLAVNINPNRMNMSPVRAIETLPERIPVRAPIAPIAPVTARRAEPQPAIMDRPALRARATARREASTPPLQEPGRPANAQAAAAQGVRLQAQGRMEPGPRPAGETRPRIEAGRVEGVKIAPRPELPPAIRLRPPATAPERPLRTPEPAVRVEQDTPATRQRTFTEAMRRSAQQAPRHGAMIDQVA